MVLPKGVGHFGVIERVAALGIIQPLHSQFHHLLHCGFCFYSEGKEMSERAS